MKPIRRLAGQTAIYGFSNILGRFINFLLVPLYTRVFIPGEYGVVTEMYVYVAFLLIVLTYGMETALFRFTEDNPVKKDRVFSTALSSVIATSAIFILAVLFFRQTLADLMRYQDNVEYIVLLCLIVGLDAIAAIPYAKLRADNRPWRFAIVRLTGIIINIGLVLFFLVLCPGINESAPEWVSTLVNRVYDPGIGVGYVFIANLAATSVSLIMLAPVVFGKKLSFDRLLWSRMLIYSLPLLVAGMAGWVNEALDKLLLKFILPEEIAMEQVGIYGAVYKLSIMMTLFVQAFRFAAEPFFFAQAGKVDSGQLFARVMNYFVITCLFIFLGIMLFIDIVKHFIGPEFHEGLSVVPVLLLANMFLGIFWNLSIWYKLTAKTIYGAMFSVTGAAITILLNIWWIPLFGYHGSAWATLVCYFTLAALSYFTGQKQYRIPYETGKIFILITAAIGVYLAGSVVTGFPGVYTYLFNVLLLLVFSGICIAAEPGLKAIFNGARRV